MTIYNAQIPELVNIVINRGDSFTKDVVVNKNLTAYTVTSWIDYGSTDIALTVTTTYNTASESKFNVLLTKTNSALILNENNYWNIKIESGAEARTIVEGNFKVIQ